MGLGMIFLLFSQLSGDREAQRGRSDWERLKACPARGEFAQVEYLKKHLKHFIDTGWTACSPPRESKLFNDLPKEIFMKTMQRTTLMLALAGALSMPALSFAADAAKDEHSGHHPDAAPAAATATTEAATTLGCAPFSA